MPETYTYKVRDRGGKMLEGTLEAESTTLVANKLRGRIATLLNHPVTIGTAVARNLVKRG